MGSRKSTSKKPAELTSVKVFGTAASVFGYFKDDMVRALIVNELLIGNDTQSKEGLEKLHERLMDMFKKYGARDKIDEMSEQLRGALGLKSSEENTSV